jgi:Domain of unknown function (DUF4830)
MLKKVFYSISLFVLIYLLVLLIMKLSFEYLIADSHRAFIEKKGWNLAFYFPKEEPFTVPEYPEALQTFHLAGVDFTGHEKTRITRHMYILKQSCDNRNLEAVILSADDKIIGSYIDIEDTYPGIRNMTKKEVVLKDICS